MMDFLKPVSLLAPVYLLLMWLVASGLDLLTIHAHLYSGFGVSQISISTNTTLPNTSQPTCLIRWYENKPLEIIICTTKEHKDEVDRIVKEAAEEGSIDLAKVKTMVSEMGARHQLLAAVMEAKGNIIATHGNHIFWSKEYIINMLPCFENSKVGAAGPSIKVHIPEERHDIVSPREVAATKLAERGPGSATMMQVAANWNWILAGTTGVYGAEILKDPRFRDGYLNGSWNGIKLDVGEDIYLSRWLLKNDWIIATQWTDETNVWRTVKQSSGLHPQMLRWERSTIQSFLRTISEVPQMWNHPLVAFRTIERIFKASIAVFHLLSWIVSLFTQPYLTVPLLAYYVYYKYHGYVKFFNKYPYMTRNWYAAVLVDYSPVYIGTRAWLTLNDNSWEHGDVRKGGWDLKDNDGEKGSGESQVL